MSNKNFYHCKFTFTRKEAEFLFNILSTAIFNHCDKCMICSIEHYNEKRSPHCYNCKHHISRGILDLDDELREFLFPSTNDDPIDDDLPF